LNGAAFYFFAVEWDVSPTTLLNSLFLSALIILVFIDYQHQILPNAITIPGAVAGILLSPFQSQGLYLDTIAFAIASKVGPDAPLSFLNWTGAALGALTGGGVLYLVARIHKVVHNLVARIREAVPKLQGLGMGMGDIKMMAMVGAFLGWRLALLTIFAGSFIGSIAGVFLILFHGRNLQSKLAFGTFLGIGAALALFFGPSFLRWYSSYLPIPIR
jgi:leader peptidase (prepilin peptidase)/N-methyltransferase